MKKILTIILCVCMVCLFIFSSCENKNSPEKENLSHNVTNEQTLPENEYEKTVTLSSSIAEQMGKPAIKLTKEQAKFFIDKINSLQLTKRSNPKNNEIPTGGSYIVLIGDKQYDFISDNLISIDGKYYVPDSPVTEIINAIAEYFA